MKLSKVRIVTICILLTSLLFTLNVSAGEAGKVFFSKYIEGSSNNKAVGIFNGYGVTLDMSNYQIWIFHNGDGSTDNAGKIALQGNLASGEVYVVAHSSANSTIKSMADLTTGSLDFNGDDAVALVQLTDKDGTTIDKYMDVIGQIGNDPGSEWSNNGVGRGMECHDCCGIHKVWRQDPFDTGAWFTDNEGHE